MIFLELLEFHSSIAILLLETCSLIAVVLFAIIFKQTFRRMSGKFLIYLFALSRLPDMLTTALCIEKLKEMGCGYSHEANFLLRWFLSIPNFSDIVVLLMYNTMVFLAIYLFYRRAWFYSSFAQLTLKAGILTLSLAGILFAILNIVFYFNL